MLARSLAMGPIPNHVAFILDGNRRWARERGMKESEGHRNGAESGKRIIDFLAVVGVKEVTMYMFSIENFNRKPEEVKILMDKFAEEIGNFEKLSPNSRFRGIGNRSLLTPFFRQALADIEENTKDKKGLIVNMAIAYTCRDDVTAGIKCVIEKEEIQNQDHTKLQQNMSTKDVSEVDILVRTSGETRLSDFLMWEVSKKYYIFNGKNSSYCYYYRAPPLGFIFWRRTGRI